MLSSHGHALRKRTREVNAGLLNSMSPSIEDDERIKPEDDFVQLDHQHLTQSVKTIMTDANTGESAQAVKGVQQQITRKGKERALSAITVPSQLTDDRWIAIFQPESRAKRPVQTRLATNDGILSLESIIGRKRKREDSAPRDKANLLQLRNHLLQPAILPTYDLYAYIPSVQEALTRAREYIMNSLLVKDAFPTETSVEDFISDAMATVNAQAKAAHGAGSVILDPGRYPGMRLLLRKYVAEVQTLVLQQAEKVVPLVWAMLFDLNDTKYEGEDEQARVIEHRLFQEGLNLALNNASFIYRDFDPLKGTQSITRPFQSKLLLEVIAAVAYKQAGVASKFVKDYTRPPLSLIAVSCWAIHHVLTCYRSGRYVKKDFIKDLGGARAIYDGFLVALDSLDAEDPGNFDKMLNCIGKECNVFFNNGIATSIGPIRNPKIPCRESVLRKFTRDSYCRRHLHAIPTAGAVSATDQSQKRGAALKALSYQHKDSIKLIDLWNVFLEKPSAALAKLKGESKTGMPVVDGTDDVHLAGVPFVLRSTADPPPHNTLSAPVEQDDVAMDEETTITASTSKLAPEDRADDVAYKFSSLASVEIKVLNSAYNIIHFYEALSEFRSHEWIAAGGLTLFLQAAYCLRGNIPSTPFNAIQHLAEAMCIGQAFSPTSGKARQVCARMWFMAAVVDKSQNLVDIRDFSPGVNTAVEDISCIFSGTSVPPGKDNSDIPRTRTKEEIRVHNRTALVDIIGDRSHSLGRYLKDGGVTDRWKELQVWFLCIDAKMEKTAAGPSPKS
ncbi:hypothetical protein CALCODRAFT_510784 [Calocera cornea HHB12733]|uniref:DUF6532 domain-containing protein n=1 Tax=Calocera cornea HHB12733 TaxID=1353952 RepID=A0A165E9G7_9BASI|nr:hypothetical protein CALCODRAFT_510784 [Calocera cornea HHB12733]